MVKFPLPFSKDLKVMTGGGTDSSAVSVTVQGPLEPKRLGADPAQCQEDHVYHVEGTDQMPGSSTGVLKKGLVIATEVK